MCDILVAARRRVAPTAMAGFRLSERARSTALSVVPSVGHAVRCFYAGGGCGEGREFGEQAAGPWIDSWL